MVGVPSGQKQKASVGWLKRAIQVRINWIGQQEGSAGLAGIKIWALLYLSVLLYWRKSWKYPIESMCSWKIMCPTLMNLWGSWVSCPLESNSPKRKSPQIPVNKIKQQTISARSDKSEECTMRARGRQWWATFFVLCVSFNKFHKKIFSK